MTAPVLALLQAADPQLPISTFWAFTLTSLAKLVIVFSVYMVSVALMTLAERKISAWIQDRRGPNRTGWGGLLQPAADGLKNFVKEETMPADVYRPLFVMAPAISFIPAMVTWAVIPFGAPLPTPWGLMPMVVADLPVGFLFTLAIASLGVYGIVLAGWASNNKYALLGGLRSSGQMVSYEISMGMSTIVVLLLAGNARMADIIHQQATEGWNILLLSVAFFIFLVSGFAETNRLPFDLPEAESELVAGYHTEYSAMKYSMFMIAEFANMITVGAMVSTLFLGGWDIPFTLWDNTPPWSVLKTVVTTLFFVAKVMFWGFFFIWIRWTLPRFRYDQLMSVGWRFMLPTALAYIVIIAVAVLALEAAGLRGVRWGGVVPAFTAILFALNIVLCFLLFFVLDRGRIVSPAGRRMGSEELARLRAASARSTLASTTGD